MRAKSATTLTFGFVCALLLVPCREARAVQRWFFFSGAQAQSLQSTPLPDEIREVIVVGEPLRRATVEFDASTMVPDRIAVAVELIRVDGKADRYESVLNRTGIGRWHGALRLRDGRTRRFRFAAGDILLFRFRPSSESGVFDADSNLFVGATVQGKPTREGAVHVAAPSLPSGADSARESWVRSAASSQAELAWSFSAGAAFDSSRAGLPRRVAVTLLASADEERAVPCLRYLHFDQPARAERSVLVARVLITSMNGETRKMRLRLEVPDDRGDTDVCFPRAIRLGAGDLASVRFRFTDLPSEKLFDSITLTFRSELSKSSYPALSGE